MAGEGGTRRAPGRAGTEVITVTKDEILDALRTVMDPELGFSIVDLGLVYEVAVKDGDIYIAVTMTTPACPLHAYLTTEIEQTVRWRFPDARSVDIELVWEPSWHPGMISAELKRAVGRTG